MDTLSHIETPYSPFEELNKLQTEIMIYISEWVRDKKTPVPHKQVLREFVIRGVKSFTVSNALNSLLHKGYVRRAFTQSNKTFYVQIRTLSV